MAPRCTRASSASGWRTSCAAEGSLLRSFFSPLASSPPAGAPRFSLPSPVRATTASSTALATATASPPSRIESEAKAGSRGPCVEQEDGWLRPRPGVAPRRAPQVAGLDPPPPAHRAEGSRAARGSASPPAGIGRGAEGRGGEGRGGERDESRRVGGVAVWTIKEPARHRGRPSSASPRPLRRLPLAPFLSYSSAAPHGSSVPCSSAAPTAPPCRTAPAAPPRRAASGAPPPPPRLQPGCESALPWSGSGPDGGGPGPYGGERALSLAASLHGAAASCSSIGSPLSTGGVDLCPSARGGGGPSPLSLAVGAQALRLGRRWIAARAQRTVAPSSGGEEPAGAGLGQRPRGRGARPAAGRWSPDRRPRFFFDDVAR
ncbi:translation initiation factor IF-2-like [Panicum virgatum]|uniref:translation initiation factor IF-2-like n=1 Tax=Panicum virgatum TaxID=38727 RepID=UPI0019D54921|nr:translation initiation factor IF-2-like [Panicum virgatum]